MVTGQVYGLRERLRLRSHFAKPRAVSIAPKGRHIIAVIRASQPAFECAPSEPTPPRTMKRSPTASRPMPRISDPQRSSSVVPSAGRVSLEDGIGLSQCQAQHDVGNDAGDGDIEPDGECPACDLAVHWNSAGE